MTVWSFIYDLEGGKIQNGGKLPRPWDIEITTMNLKDSVKQKETQAFASHPITCHLRK